MFSYELAVQSDANQRAVCALLERAARAAPFTRLRAAFAYASAGGAQLAASTLAEVTEGWEALDKRWLISFDWGHTDPEAIELLASLPRSQVRVPYAEDVLRRNLTPTICFHPKTAIFDRGRVRTPPAAILVGSANLTVSGLETGHEHAAAAIWVSGRLSPDAAAQLAAMREQGRHADRVWRTATPISAALLDEYRRRRRRVRWTNEDASERSRSVIEDGRRFELPLDVSARVASAGSLWVEVRYVVENRGAGVPGNQIDLQRGTRVFFGFGARPVPRNTLLGDVVIAYRGHVSTHHMRYGNNFMDKLNLPIPGAGGPPDYRDTTLLLERQPDGTYRLELGSARQVRSWKARSRRQETLFTMQGGRQWGVFS